MSASNINPAPNQKVHGGYTKSHLYGSPRHSKKRPPRRSRNNGCCLCCSCLIVLLLLLLLLAAIAGLVSWVIYRPKLPKISLTSVQVPKFNVTAGYSTGNSTLASEFVVNLLAVNRNKKVGFVYGDSPVKLSSRGVEIAAGTIPGFLNPKDNSTVVSADLKGDDVALDDSDARRLRAAGSRGEITLDVQLVTHVGVKIKQWKSYKVRVEVTCKGVSAQISQANNSSAASADSNSKCKFKVRIKFFRWYL